jgi:hypothetical protein
MMRNAAWLILIAIGLTGCHKAAKSPAGEPSKSAKGSIVVEWFKMPPVPKVTQQDTLIPILRIGGTYLTTSRGMEIPLVKTAEGLKWGLAPSPLSDTIIGYFGPSYPCSIHIVDRTRANFDPSYNPDTVPPVLMTKVDKPAGLLDAKAPRPRKLDDFLGFYHPIWFPWVHMEIRKDGGRYWSVERSLASPKPPLQWAAQGRPQMITPMTDGLGFIGFPGGPSSLIYNEAQKRFELVRMDNGVKMPLAKVSGKKDVPLPALPIGIPAWN